MYLEFNFTEVYFMQKCQIPKLSNFLVEVSDQPASRVRPWAENGLFLLFGAALGP
jgi:hypothetical protein